MFRIDWRSRWDDVRVRIATVALLALVGTVLGAQTGLFDRLRWWAYDWHQSALPAALDLDEVAIIDIDDASTTALERRLGPWPYDRTVFAQLNDFLRAAGARAVGYHLALTEARSGDAALSSSLAPNVVLGAMGLPVPSFDAANTSTRLAAVSLRQLGATTAWPHHTWRAIRLPADTITDLRPGNVGIVNHAPDDDGTARRIGVLYGAGAHLLPSLSLATLMSEGGPRTQISLRGRELRVGTLAIKLTETGEALVRFPESVASLRSLSFREVLDAAEGRTPRTAVTETVRGRTVFVGRLVPPAGDYMQTPVGPLAGIELVALGHAALRGGNLLSPALWWVDLLLVAAALALPLLLVKRGTAAGPRQFLAALAALALGITAVGTALFALGIDSRWLFALLGGMTATVLAALVWLAAVYDDRRRLEVETRSASEANKLKTEFLHHLTHELRTPLTAIMGFNKINQLTDDLGKQARIANSEVIGRNCQHLLMLINNHLDLAKITAGTLALAPTPEDPEKLCREAVSSLQSLANEKRLRLRFVKRTPLPHALSLDASRVRQILINLIGNAIKFTQAGSVELVASWHVAVLSLEVRDSGPGIPPAALERIFEPFEQADHTVAARFGGTGLGLTIAKKLVDLMSGAIEVESELGVGTTFRVRLPVEVAVAAPAQEPASLDAAREALAGRVLVAEDNEDIRKLLELQLSKLGLEIKIVANGFSAVEATLGEKYDVVLMDMEMPVMNGFEAVNVLRTRGYTNTILALTAYHSGPEAERALASGCDGLVTKPTSVESLRRALAPLLPGLPRRQLTRR